MTAPVVLISFNRPEATRRTLQSIGQAAPDELFLIADGPRPGREEDALGCAAVREELAAVDWPCRVHRRYSEENRGIDATVESGLDWVFDQVGEAIVLEDDCVPHPDFFRFCSELLERHRDTDAVWQICGRAPTVPDEVFEGASYCFTAIGPIWGWATWARAWHAHRSRTTGAVDLRGSRLLSRSGRRYFEDIAHNPAGDVFLWDSRWALSVVTARGLAAIPRRNLIENIGFGEQASNTRTAIPQRGLEPLECPVIHPPKLALNPEVELLCERVAASRHGRAARFFARHLRPAAVRALARSTAGAWWNRRASVR